MDSQVLEHRVESKVAKKVANIRLVQRGYSPAKRAVILFTDGSSLFAKMAVNEMTSNWLRNELLIYESLETSFLPKYYGWDDDEDNPILLLEDLSDAYWPPPWKGDLLTKFLATLEEIWDSSVPGIPSISDTAELVNDWCSVADYPKPFLSLGLTSEKWLNESLPRLTSIETTKIIEGDSMLHLDIRSDNMCIKDGRAIFIDWNNVCLGNADVDLGFWLPSLAAEGGPLPDTLLPDNAAIAVLVSSYFAFRAGQPIIPEAPKVRQVQLKQLKEALPWVTRALDLPPLFL